MQELTLTGGTLLSSDKNQPNIIISNTTNNNNNKACEKKECCDKHHDNHHNHNHKHHDNHNHHNHDNHNHNHNHTTASMPMMQMPAVTLNMPAAQLVQQDVPEVLKALKIVTRMGSLALLQEIMQAWKEHIIATTTTVATTTSGASSSSSKNKAKAMAAAEKVIAAHVSKVDPEGHSLLHWAAKRGDGNAAFCHYWTKYVTPITLKSNDGTGMTCLHWACTENASSASSLSIIRHLLSVDVSLLETPDASGCTPLLIAAQYGQVTTAAYLIQVGANYASSMDENRDTATHWAAYKGSAAVLGLLVYYLQARHLTQPDAYGQLPLHLAALRGHVSVCRYIVNSIINQGHHNNNNGDDINGTTTTTATSRMAATIRNKRQALDCLLLKDKNGRTPEALARHKKKPVVAAVLQQITEDLQHQLYTQQQTTQQQQQRGNNRSTTATMIKTRLYHACWHPTMVVMKSITSKHRWMVWLGIPPVSENGMALDEQDEAPNFPFHYVIGNAVANFIFYWSVFIPVLSTRPDKMSYGVLYDYLLFHVFNMIIFCINITMLIYTHRTDPGRLVSSSTTIDNNNAAAAGILCCTGTDKKQQAKMNQIVDYWRRKYEETLEAYAQDDYHDGNKNNNKAVEYQLCHTCHLARPLRSKHDKYSHACILLFDHYCPFVGTSIGLYNYKYFYTFLLTMTIYFFGYWYMLIVYISRHRQAAAATAAGSAASTASSSSMPWMTIALGVYLGLHVLLSGGMLLYHTQLVIANLTTNEHLNVARYNYLWTAPTASSSSSTAQQQQQQPQRRYKNPWFHGWWGNFLDRFNPSEASYMLPEQHEGLLPQQQQQQQQRPIATTTFNTINSNNDPLSSVV